MFYSDISPAGGSRAASHWHAKTEHEPLLVMMMLGGVILWLVFVFWYHDLLLLLYSNDRSRICWLISLIFVIMLVHCMLRSIRTSRISNDTIALTRALSDQKYIYMQSGYFTDSGGSSLPVCPALILLREKLLPPTAKQAADTGNIRDWLYEHIGRGNQTGWFAADFMIKLGLLGTVVGFIFMLGSITRMEDVDTNSMRFILQEMGTGMATALLTTMAGLVCSMLLGVLYFVLEHYSLALIDSNHHLFEQARNSLRQDALPAITPAAE